MSIGQNQVGTRQIQTMKAADNKTGTELIVEMVNAAEDEVTSVDVHRALKRRLRGKAPSYRTVRRKLAALAEEGVIARTGKYRHVKYQRMAETPVPDAIDDVKPVNPVSS